MMGQLNDRPLKVGMTDSFGYSPGSWLGGEFLTDYTVTGDDKIQIDATSSDGTQIAIIATGLSEGIAEVIFDYHTPTRHDTFKMSISIIEY